MKPLLSIIITSLKLDELTKHHLNVIITLIEKQSYTSEVILIVPGASETMIKHPSVRIVADEKKGIYSAFNIGLKSARGTYIYFSNPGDTPYLLPKDFDTSKSAYCFAVDVFKGSEFVFKRLPRHSSRKMPPHQGMFIKRDLHELFNQSYHFAGDLDFWLAFKRKYDSDIEYSDTPIAKFQLGGASNDMKNIIRRKYERFQVLWKHR